jgi:hypothetical protein
MDHTWELDTGIYRVTDMGRVFTQSKLKIPLVGKGMEHTGEFKVILKPEREMTYTINNRGYKTVGINKTTYMVHRLVATHFCSNPYNKPYVNHLDGNKLNNFATNLEWCTTQENVQHSFDAGLRTPAGRVASQQNLINKSKLTADEVRYVRRVHIARHKDFSSTALAAVFGTSVTAMSKIVKGETYPHVK